MTASAVNLLLCKCKYLFVGTCDTACTLNMLLNDLNWIDERTKSACLSLLVYNQNGVGR